MADLKHSRDTSAHCWIFVFSRLFSPDVHLPSRISSLDTKQQRYCPWKTSIFSDGCLGNSLPYSSILFFCVILPLSNLSVFNTQSVIKQTHTHTHTRFFLKQKIIVIIIIIRSMKKKKERENNRHDFSFSSQRTNSGFEPLNKIHNSSDVLFLPNADVVCHHRADHSRSFPEEVTRSVR